MFCVSKIHDCSFTYVPWECLKILDTCCGDNATREAWNRQRRVCMIRIRHSKSTPWTQSICISAYSYCTMPTAVLFSNLRLLFIRFGLPDDNDDIHIHRNQACLRPLALTTMYADPIHRAVNNADLLKYPSDNSKGGFAKGWVCKSDHRMYCYDDAPMNSSLSPFRVVMGPSVQ